MNKIKYRQTALEQVTSPEKLTELIRVVTPQDWIVLSGLLILLFALIIWGFLGSIPTRVTGEGILLAKNGGVYDAIAPEGEARVISIKVKLGDRVKKNDIVAYLEVPDISEQVIIQEKYLQQLQDKYSTLSQRSQQEIDIREKQANQTQQILQRTIKSESEHLSVIQDLLTRKQDLLKKGLINRQQLLDTLNDLYAAKQRIEDANNQLIQSTVTLNSFKEEWQQRLRDLNLKIIDTERELEKLKKQAYLNKTVHTPVNGIVTVLHLGIGDHAKGGTPVISVADESEEIDALLYVPAQEGQRIKIGAESLISPQTIEKEEFGSIKGHVIAVSKFPSTPESMKASLHNDDLVKRFSPEGAASIAVRVSLLADSTTPSGFKWTSGKGPQQFITPGMVVKGEITVREQSPISLVIPTLRRWIQG